MSNKNANKVANAVSELDQIHEQIMTAANKNEFYLGIDDVTVFRGKKNHMKPYGKSKRFITEKFFKDPTRAAELVYMNQIYKGHNRNKTYDAELINKFWSSGHYDPKNKMFVLEEYLTIGTLQQPKQCQLDCFNKGQYEFIMLRHEIQVMRTDIVELKK